MCEDVLHRNTTSNKVERNVRIHILRLKAKTNAKNLSYQANAKA